MAENKSHYYDGIIYDKFIAPNQDLIFRLIKSLIKEDSTVLDVGCGTGRLAFQLAEKCSGVVGLDLSLRNIKTAEKNRIKRGIENVKFVHESLEEFEKSNKRKFDYAVMTYVLHEVKEEERLNLLNKMANVANRIIIGDYLVPRPKSHFLLNEFIEFIAGREHYKGFKSFVRVGGLKYYFEKAGIKIIKEIKGKPVTSHIVMGEK